MERQRSKRLDQFISNTGQYSRREAGALIRQGRVRVNGEIESNPETRLTVTTIAIDDVEIGNPGAILVMLNKPLGYVCSHDSSEGPRIYDLLPSEWMVRKQKPVSIGRLDKDTTGLILITDQTTLVHSYTSPKHHVEKGYEVEVDKALHGSLIELFASGTIVLNGEEKPCLPAQLSLTHENKARVFLSEGKYHQVRRMFAYAGYSVVKLHRFQFGPYLLGDLAEGAYKQIELE